MATMAFNSDSRFSLGHVYMNMMRHLSDATKLEIINLLSASLLRKEQSEVQVVSERKIDLHTCFQGDWGKDKSTEEYCDELRRDLLPTKEIDL